MKEFIHIYKNPNEERLNFSLMNKENDSELVEYLIDAFKSLDVLKYIKLLEWEYIDDETKINPSDYIRTRKSKTKRNNYEYQYIDDSRLGELRLKFLLDCKGDSKIFTKNILVPLQTEDGHFLLKGKKYFMLYQLVDASTYNSNSKITLKSAMAVTLKRSKREFINTKGVAHSAPVYSTFLFKKELELLLIYVSKIGMKKTLRYFSVNNIIRFVSEIGDEETKEYFSINKNLFIEVDKYFFDKYVYVRSMTFMILTICSNRVTEDLLNDKNYWIEKLGSVTATNKNSYYEKGLSTLLYFDRLLNNTTKNILKVDKKNKKNIYTVVRWMVQNYAELRAKDNMDLSNKRLRCNEYIASLLSMALNEKANRVMASGKNNINIKKIEEILAIPGDILITQLFKSGLLRYDDTINDMDIFNKLKFTLKGPNSLGNKNSNNITMKNRGIHPSFLGRIDLNRCGNSDPGTSGVLTPFCKMDGLYFEDKPEPEEFQYEFVRDTLERFKETGEKTVVELNIKSKEEFYNPRFTEIDKITITKNDHDKLIIRIGDKMNSDDI